ncbi:Ankyrin repeat [Cichlidogyrus casuarinus]|uniref:Ankyrin repeat n=1 Tax=Cichlidogyrus casuarinus TaxID=1844966 RepID=A0ABD2QIP0_9PLAT
MTTNRIWDLYIFLVSRNDTLNCQLESTGPTALRRISSYNNLTSLPQAGSHVPNSQSMNFFAAESDFDSLFKYATCDRRNRLRSNKAHVDHSADSANKLEELCNTANPLSCPMPRSSKIHASPPKPPVRAAASLPPVSTFRPSQVGFPVDSEFPTTRFMPKESESAYTLKLPDNCGDSVYSNCSSQHALEQGEVMYGTPKSGTYGAGLNSSQSCQTITANCGEWRPSWSREVELRADFNQRDSPEKGSFGLSIRTVKSVVGTRTPQTDKDNEAVFSPLDVAVVQSYQPCADRPSLQMVKRVRPESSAHHVGIREGDFVLEINGQNVQCMGHEEVIDILSSLTGRSIRLKLTRPLSAKVAITPNLPNLVYDQLDIGLPDLDSLRPPGEALCTDGSLYIEHARILDFSHSYLSDEYNSANDSTLQSTRSLVRDHSCNFYRKIRNVVPSKSFLEERPKQKLTAGCTTEFIHSRSSSNPMFTSSSFRPRCSSVAPSSNFTSFRQATQIARGLSPSSSASTVKVR